MSLHRAGGLFHSVIGYLFSSPIKERGWWCLVPGTMAIHTPLATNIPSVLIIPVCHNGKGLRNCGTYKIDRRGSFC